MILNTDFYLKLLLINTVDYDRDESMESESCCELFKF